MDYGNLAQIGSFAVSVLTLIFVIGTYRSKAANDRVNALAAKIERLEEQTSRLEGTVSHLPDAAAMHRMELAFEKMQGAMNVMAEKLKAVASTADRLQDFLAEHSAPEPRKRTGR
jgi:uncharacterized coiled-coil protein SlyX